ncbi:MAG: DUF5696 domain-containing protein [Planctomycetota bacterium]|jgi:hypothetical protein
MDCTLTSSLGRFTVSEETFFTFVPENSSKEWNSTLPFRIFLWDVPCQRQTEFNNYNFKIKNLKETTGGLHATLEIADCFRIDFEISLHEESFHFRLLTDTLCEYQAHCFRLMALDVMPSLFSADHGSEGYFVLPNYCGAISSFKAETKVPFEFRDRVYMDQSVWENYGTMPLCGMTLGSAGWLCILSSGQFDADIVTRRFKEEDESEYQLCPSFIFRHEKHDAVIDSNKELRFFYHAEDCDYNRMAHTYRSYLLNHRKLTPLSERLAGNIALEYAANSYHCKIFQGMKMNRTVDGQEEMTVCATFDQVYEMAEYYKQAGIERCLFILVGWNPEGHDGMWPTRFPIEPSLGGEEGFKTLAVKLNELGYQLTVHDNHMDAYKCSPEFDSVLLAHDRAQEPVGGSQWGGGVTYRVCPSTYPREQWKQDMERLQELGVNGMYYLDNMPGPLFECHHPDHKVTRQGWAEGMGRATREARDRFGCIACEGYIDYLAESYDLAWHVPIADFPFLRFPVSSIIDRLVPFYQVAFHGIMLYHAGYAHHFAEMGFGPEQVNALELAFGALPLNEVAYTPSDKFTVAPYKENIEMMALGYKNNCEKWPQLHQQFIERIDIDENGRVVTTYEDGTQFEASLNISEK